MKNQQNKKFWNFSPPQDNNSPAELILYGDIASETWWGDEVTPRLFSEELNALGNVNEIIVRINSGGGDVFAANAIYTRLKDHKAKITVKIDGWAASAATIIAMAGDITEIPGNGVFMIHRAKMGLLGYYGQDDFEKMIEEIKVINQSIVNGYALKTGKEPDEIAELMTAETWYDGKTAVEAGFVDKLMFEEAETQVENASKVIVNAVTFNLARFPNIPTTLLNRCASHSFGGFTNINNSIKERKTMDIKTVEELKAAYPQLTNEIASEATAAERKRIQDIEGVALAGFDSLIQAAKYEKPVTAGELATAIIAEQKKQGNKYLENRETDLLNGNVNNVGTSGHEGANDFTDVSEFDRAIDAVLPTVQ